MKVLLSSIVLLAACGAPQDSKYPARESGCEIKIFQDTPPVPTDNIGPVTATCDPELPDPVCMRTLQDEACKLGADVVWGVEAPTTVATQVGQRKKFSGRAAHTKAN